MRRRGILLRDRNSDPGCAGCVRITIGTDAQTDVGDRSALRGNRSNEIALARDARWRA